MSLSNHYTNKKMYLRKSKPCKTFKGKDLNSFYLKLTIIIRNKLKSTKIKCLITILNKYKIDHNN